MERQKSSVLCGASPKKDHEAGGSDPRKRKIEDTEDREAHNEAALFAATIHHKVQPSARPDQIWATSQQKTNTQGQDVDEMDIDSSNMDEERDSNFIMEATKKMGIKPANEVKTDLDWAERDLLSWILAIVQNMQLSPLKAHAFSSSRTSFPENTPATPGFRGILCRWNGRRARH